MTDKALVPIEQKEVEFYGDSLIAIRVDDGQIYASVRHMCEALGIARQGQVRRIRDHSILSKGFGSGNVLLPVGTRQAQWLRVDLVPLWLSGLRVKSVKAELRPKLERFQEQVAKVLWEAFREGRLTIDPIHDEIMLSDSPSAVAYRLAEEAAQRVQAIRALALQQYKHEQHLLDHDRRLETIEAQLGNPERLITNSQAERISQAVKAVALELGRRSGKNEHGGVYGEVYRTFSITSYKELPASRYEECMQMLTDWHESLVDGVKF